MLYDLPIVTIGTDRQANTGKREENTVNCKETECIADSKRDRPRSELRNEDLKIKQVQKFLWELL